MTRKRKTTTVSVEVPVAKPIEPVVVAEEQETDIVQDVAPKKKRIRRKQSVKLHNKKLSVAVICANPYIRQFS